MKGEPAEQLVEKWRAQGDAGVLVLTFHVDDVVELAGLLVDTTPAEAAQLLVGCARFAQLGATN
jgi:hypothetical protein